MQESTKCYSQKTCSNGAQIKISGNQLGRTGAVFEKDECLPESALSAGQLENAEILSSAEDGKLFQRERHRMPAKSFAFVLVMTCLLFLIAGLYLCAQSYVQRDINYAPNEKNTDHEKMISKGALQKLNIKVQQYKGEPSVERIQNPSAGNEIQEGSPSPIQNLQNRQVQEKESIQIKKQEASLKENAQSPIAEKKVEKSVSLNEKLQSAIIGNKKEEDPTNSMATFTQKSHNTRHFASLFGYLSHNKAQTVLQINCNSECLTKAVNEAKLFKLSVENWSEDKVKAPLQNTQGKSDWISCESFQFCANLFLKNQFLLETAKYGVSFRNPKIQEFNSHTIIQHFKDHGFYYDDAKSLSLTQTQKQLVLLFIRGDPEQYALPFQKPTKNAIAIHAVFRMLEHIEYLHEWIGYHLNLGVDKIFLYDNSKSARSDLPTGALVSGQTTKIGLNLACFNKTPQEIKQKWEDIWLQFYDHIVYVLWEPKDQNGTIIYGQVKALKNYELYFKNVAKFTAFIDIDEFLFSPDNLNLEQHLRRKESQGVTGLRIKSKHFSHRVCGPYKRVTDIVYSYPHNLEKKPVWGPKVICVTKKYKIGNSIHDGTTTSGLLQNSPENQLRFNHYTLESRALIYAVTSNFSNVPKLIVDDSLQKRYSNKIDDICKDKCSQNFAISCPPGKSSVICINPEETLPTTKKEAKKFKLMLEQRKNGNQ